MDVHDAPFALLVVGGRREERQIQSVKSNAAAAAETTAGHPSSRTGGVGEVRVNVCISRI